SLFRPSSGFDHAEDVFFPEDQVFDAVQLDLAARVLAEQHPVALLHVERQDLAVLALAGPDGDHLTLLGLLLRGVGNDDASLALLLLLLEALYDDAVAQGPNTRCHDRNLLLGGHRWGGARPSTKME